MTPKVTPSRALAAASLFAIAGYSAYRYRISRLNSNSTPPAAPGKMTADNSFETLFAVPLSCDGCIKAVSDSLYKLRGITKVEGNLKDQLISVKGTAAPSAIVEAIQETGRDAILRGSGASDSMLKLFTSTQYCDGSNRLLATEFFCGRQVNASLSHMADLGNRLGAAVSILETFEDPVQGRYEEPSRDVRGLARMVQVSSGRTLVDLTVRGVAPGTYRASIRAYGDLKDGARSTGPVWSGENKEPRGELGVVAVGEDGRGAAFVDHGFQIWEVIGHAMVLTRQEEGTEPLKNDKDTVVGIIARSAGMWDNDKTVCSCTGKTLWEERQDEVKKGML
ncbi:superoxide dismutase 1 copper chaperone [Fusarium albosuccineum]|uniref:Superoxide dismutase 1 copper chaperone n=1 Tax=Fusarium albosuccineum TaxID=1237068 RepID=A0A8H4LKU3_9HYPO|nr:superoxide dismutase 1 copper chaperone [Fusarium albosuccineum]